MIAVATRRRASSSPGSGPRWFRLKRRPEICTSCGRLIPLGETVFYLPFPRRSFYCDQVDCGPRIARMFPPA